MITNIETNTLYISSLLKDKKPTFYNRFLKNLKSVDIIPKEIVETNDIWCRDYMPIQIAKNTLLQFDYNPNYLNTKKYVHLRSNLNLIINSNDFFNNFKIIKTNIILDGGNIVKSSDTIILTDKIFTENYRKNVSGLKYIIEEDKIKLVDKIKTVFNVKKVIVVPRLPNDWLGHTDGMLRFYDDNTILLNDWKSISAPRLLKQKLKETYDILKKHNFTIIDNIPHYEYSKNFYINYFHIGKYIFLPQFNNRKLNDEALSIFNNIFKECDIIPVQASEIETDNGVLNCITWNIKK